MGVKLLLAERRLHVTDIIADHCTVLLGNVEGVGREGIPIQAFRIRVELVDGTIRSTTAIKHTGSVIIAAYTHRPSRNQNIHVARIEAS